ncbi:cytochrome P450 [Microbacterium sp. A8/3-1]|uniref:Cytochrome P450 n=1 Tax=Microbacterium sp. A8/3-1 TaxID=3160749 RepID=A0AAU7VXY5_9MICO
MTVVEAPVADWVDVQELLRDPYPIYRRLTTEVPVAWVPALSRYLVTSYDLCRAVEEDQELFSASVTGAGATMVRALGGTPMLRKDDPEHAADRAPLNPVLRPRSLKQAWQPRFAATALKYVDVLKEIGPDAANLDRDFAAPVASQNLIDLIGIPSASVEDMRRWSSSFVAATGNLLDDPGLWQEAEASQAEVEIALADLIPRYRAQPNASILSALANSDLSREDIAANVKLAISGGMNEPQHAITTSVHALSIFPSQRSAVLDDPTLWPAVFDEAIRWISPIGMYPRETTRATNLGGVDLPAGASIGVVVGAANRDPAHLENPELFDLARGRTPHLAFGSGVHLCAGHWAARLSIGETAVPTLFRELPGLKVDMRRPSSFVGWVFRGASELPVTWDH